MERQKEMEKEGLAYHQTHESDDEYKMRMSYMSTQRLQSRNSID